MGNWFELQFPSESINERFARSVAKAFVLPLWDWTVSELDEIAIAVSEAVTNSIIHGYDTTPGTITLRGKAETGAIILEIEDQGKGIEDIEQARQPQFTTKPLDERTGMGFVMMESLMDEVEVSSSVGLGTLVRMTKLLNV